MRQLDEFFLVAVFTFTSPAHAANFPDLNNDNKVNIFDYNILVAAFGKTGAIGWIKADIDKNGKVNIFDYNLLVANFGKTDPDKVLVGVRFWPAYFAYGNNGHYKRNTHEQWLANPQWKDRWPYYTIIRSDTPTNTTIDIHQDDQRVIDQEIQLAAAAGLDYWALETNSIDPKWNLSVYLKSPYKNQLKFALITAMGDLAGEKWEGYVSSMIGFFKDAQYVRVGGQRPLLFMEQFDGFVSKLGGKEAAKRKMEEFSNRVKAAVGTKPYLVLFNWSSESSWQDAKYFSFDAQALYNCRTVERVSDAPYSSLTAGCEERWARFTSSDLGYVPTAQVAYDPRSRSEAKTGEDASNAIWYRKGSPTEIANHVKRAMNWVRANPSIANANTVLIAAWSDYSEGGWLEPTLREGNARLNALAKVLGGRQMAVPPSPYASIPSPAPHPVGNVTNLSVSEGTTFKANQPIHITGNAPAAARINFKLNRSERAFINGDSNNYYKQDTLGFAVDLPALPPGGPYNLVISSPDIETVRIKNIMIR